MTALTGRIVKVLEGLRVGPTCWCRQVDHPSVHGHSRACSAARKLISDLIVFWPERPKALPRTVDGYG